MPRGRGRTWIRNALMLLVVTGLVASVLAYAMPHMREVSRQQTCAENLKHLGEACAMYQSNWHDVLVPYGSPFAWTGHKWNELLYPYVQKLPGFADQPMKRARVFMCPALPPEEECSFSEGYGMNRECGGWMTGDKPVVVRLKSVKYPARTVRIADTRKRGSGGTSSCCTAQRIRSKRCDPPHVP